MKKLVITIFLSFLFLFITSSIAHAGATNTTPQEHAAAKEDYQTNGNVSSTVHVVNVYLAQLWELTCWLGNISACTTKANQQLPYLRNSVIGQVSDGITYLYTVPPASTNQFIAYYAGKLNLAQPAYAQGIGFSGLSPLLPLWRVFRNVAYGFLILIMVSIGFMVLFRMKIDPRTVISVQNALPRVVITLILITFSYAIVGLMIDLMYLSILVLVSLVNTLPGGLGSFAGTTSNYTGGSMWAIGGAMWSSGWNSIGSLTNFIGGWPLNAVSGIIGGVIPGLAVGLINPFAGIATFVAGGAIGAAAPNVLVALLVLIAVLFAMVRVFILLITSYIQIILGVIFGPLQLMFGAIPNVNSFGSWMRGLIANLAVFPITMGLMLLSTILTHMTVSSNLWTPPGLGGGQAEGVAGIIGLAMVLTIPNIAGAVKEALKSKPVISATPGVVLGPVGSIGGATMQAISLSYYLRDNPILSGVRGLFGAKRSGG